MDRPRQVIQSLGEIAIRVGNLDAMVEFYTSTFGFEVHGRFEKIVFLKVAADQAGHTQLLVLFDSSVPPDHHSLAFRGLDSTRSTIHHMAFTIPLTEYDAERRRLEALGLAVDTAEHPWVKYRSLFVADPEGNTIELVCRDPALESSWKLTAPM